MSEPRILRHIRRRMSLGYQPLSSWRRTVRVVEDGPDDQPPDGCLRLAFILPTHLRRANGTDLASWFEPLLEQFSEVASAFPGQVTVTVLVGMQWFAPDEEPTALRHLDVLGRLGKEHRGVRVVGLCLPGPGKMATLNAGIRLADRLRIDAVGWLDDDVVLEPGCLRNLVGAFLAGGARGAVGATKVPHAHRYVTSRLLYQAKEITQTAMSYPHGCCLLVARSAVTGGIPDRYACDDGYICFRLLDPEAEDAMHDLRLVPEARCHYYVAGPAGQTRRRIRRLLLNVTIYLADWSYPVSRHYFRHVLFDGMWPLTDWDGSKGARHGAARAAIKWLYFAWFARTAAELYLRGVVGRPLRQIDWAEYQSAASPGATSDTSTVLTEAQQ